MTNRFVGADAVVSALRPSDPLLLLRPGHTRDIAAAALNAFPGAIAYAVKVCDRPEMLRALAAAGVRDWDVASIHEVRTVHALMPGATLHYMNPVKPREHIAEAYRLGVRVFAFDTEAEFDKLRQATGGDPAVVPMLRVAVPNDKAKFALDRKFGCTEPEAVHLLTRATGLGYRPGVTFHVGSQCEDADAWRVATEIACGAAAQAGIEPSIVDIGGGYPAAYRGDEPSFATCTAAAKAALDARFPRFGGLFQCEPGRVLAAPSATALVRVELRKGEALFLNDGFYGLLSELHWMPGMHPMRLIRPDGASRAPLAPFSLYGPTCDSFDAMDGPYLLPSDVDEGDWIEIELMGAYSSVLASRFNGFPAARALVIDPPGRLRAAA